jgi:hypothetical protein
MIVSISIVILPFYHLDAPLLHRPGQPAVRISAVTPGPAQPPFDDEVGQPREQHAWVKR